MKKVSYRLKSKPFYYCFNLILLFQARNYIKSLPPLKKRNLYEVFQGASLLAIDLLDQMLELDSDKRITATQALSHPYLAQYADPSDEPESALYDQTFEDYDLPVEKWRGNFFSIFILSKGTIVVTRRLQSF